MRRLLILLLLFVPFAGARADEPVAVRRLLTYLPLGTGSPSGTYFPLGTAFANVINTRLSDVNMLALPTGGSVENARLLIAGEIRLAIVQSDVFHNAIRGEGEFAGRESCGRRMPVAPQDPASAETDGTGLRALVSLYPEVVQFVVRADSPVTSIGGLKGRRVILGEKGSGGLKTALMLLSHYGIGESDLTPGYLSFDAAIGAMARGEWDAAVFVAGLPTRAVTEMAARVPVRLLPVPEAEAGPLCKAMSYFSQVSIPAGTYPGIGAAQPAVALRALLVGRKDLPDAIAAAIVRTLFAEVDYLTTMHPRAADLSPATMADAVPEGFLHPACREFRK